jgi:hypothetical protein
MKTRPTPETDAFAIKFKTPCGEKYWVPVDIARKLERELAEARGQRDRLAADLRIIADGTSCRECGGEDQAFLAREALQSLFCDALQSLTPNQP